MQEAQCLIYVRAGGVLVEHGNADICFGHSGGNVSKCPKNPVRVPVTCARPENPRRGAFAVVPEGERRFEMFNPDLVARDESGKPYTVRYEAVNAMLLNEFLEEHREVESLKKAMAEQQRENEAMRDMLKEQAAQIQKVSDRLAASQTAPPMLVKSQ